MSDTPVLQRILYSKEQLAERIAELGREISADYRGKQPLFVGILRGCIMFYADLLREISVDCTMDFMCLSSYSGTSSTGEVRTMLDLRESIKGRHVVIVEDIVDTGLTLDYLMKNLQSRGAASIEICCLLDKPANRKAEVHPKYIGFQVENEFVIGYGLDYDELYRNLPYIGVFKK
ncbi:MAG: hypoxanthine phosphoribosyltransferase [Elusimicrobiaceae bacterium]|nr:hypoxanthine phosphoribosyltransferase [Elusimicrobiaceae bacterium]MBR2504335.1 hypoxanthine phosphoribosyltransferase [Elusimicrobiaceae bacterium]MBR5609260.1 hypoxanthine phosphoribosyltransferase [Elusimicrobiaceae bacterium]